MSLSQEKADQPLSGKKNQESQQKENKQKKSKSLSSTYHGPKKRYPHSSVKDDQESQQKKFVKKHPQTIPSSTLPLERKDQSSSVKKNQNLEKEAIGQQESPATALVDQKENKKKELTSKSKEKSSKEKQTKKASPKTDHLVKPKSEARFKEKQNAPLDGHNNTHKAIVSFQVKKSRAFHQNIFRNKVNSFLQDYTKVYESQNLKKFLSFFTPQAEENGKSIKDLRTKYKNTFQKTKEIDYNIKIKKWTSTNQGVQVQGQFQIKAILQDESKINSTGSIKLELQPYMESFRVSNLSYSFND